MEAKKDAVSETTWLANRGPGIHTPQFAFTSHTLSMCALLGIVCSGPAWSRSSEMARSGSGLLGTLSNFNHPAAFLASSSKRLVPCHTLLKTAMETVSGHPKPRAGAEDHDGSIVSI